MEQDDRSVIPKDLRDLRACRVCLLVKTYEQFTNDGCENCLNIWNPDYVNEFVTSNFQGVTAMFKSDRSWVRKWQGIKPHHVNGLYAISVDTRISASRAREMEM